MSLFNTAVSIPRSAVTYVTIGALTLVWSGIWYVYVLNEPTHGETTLYWCYGFLLTGLTLVLIGLAIGWVARIRRPDRAAEAPRAEGASAEAPATAPTLAPAIPAAPVAIASNNRGPSALMARVPIQAR
jgi:hypothetical protein